jgi:hypothetical protein
MIEKAEQYANSNDENVKVLIEFITKKTAALFFSTINQDCRFEDYKILLLSGDILDLGESKLSIQ